MKIALKRKVIITSLFISVIGLSVSSRLLLEHTIESNVNSNKDDVLLANNITEKPASVLITDENNLEDDSFIDEDKANDIESEKPDTNIHNDENQQEKIVYDGLTLDELSAKLDRSLNSTLSGTGNLFATKSLELGIDPYLVVAIVLHETGCSWECSELVNQCYNVGGQKGAPGCWGGSYQAFNSLEEGINSYIDNLYYNYYSAGLTTPEAINTRYATSQEWSSKINWYIDKIKAS